MALTLRASNGLELTAEPNAWIVGLVLLLDDAEKARLIEIVAGMAQGPLPVLVNGIEKKMLPDGTHLTLINGATQF
jgi:hypothetical protein